MGHLSKVGLPCDIKRAAIVHDGRLDPGVQLITKPFVFSELASRLRMVLDGEAPRRTY
ncbi:MAG TPA: hypothetical protein VNA21_10615 [Steroidobacteraceae bacterium]|nr:hypothetical protein [Steroidobacteraceae bacterium]